MEFFEYMDTMMTEVSDWMEYEEDCKSDPWGF